MSVVAIMNSGELGEALPLPEALTVARNRVARDLDLPVERLTRKEYGSSLTMRYASRLDQIHFKLQATVDRAGGKHLSDLKALKPQCSELLAAARWTRTHDPSDGFLSMLTEVLAYFEVEDADLGA